MYELYCKQTQYPEVCVNVIQSPTLKSYNKGSIVYNNSKVLRIKPLWDSLVELPEKTFRPLKFLRSFRPSPMLSFGLPS